MTKKVLLTGISGWIAKHTAIELLNSGFEVLGTVRKNNLIEQTKETLSKYASIDKLSFVELYLLNTWVYKDKAAMKELFDDTKITDLVSARDTYNTDHNITREIVQKEET